MKHGIASDKSATVTNVSILTQVDMLFPAANKMVIFLNTQGILHKVAVGLDRDDHRDCTESLRSHSLWVPQERLQKEEEVVQKQRRVIEEMVGMIKTLKAQIDGNGMRYRQQHATVVEQGALIRQLSAKMELCRFLHPLMERA